MQTIYSRNPNEAGIRLSSSLTDNLGSILSILDRNGESVSTVNHQYKQDNNRTLKGWIIAFVLAFPLILLLTWIEMPE